MLTAIKGYYDGKNIIVDDDIPLQKGQRVIITADTEDKPTKKIDLKEFMGCGEKMFHGDAAEFIKKLRENDRI